MREGGESRDAVGSGGGQAEAARWRWRMRVIVSREGWTHSSSVFPRMLPLLLLLKNHVIDDGR